MLDVPHVKMKLIETVKLVIIHMYLWILPVYNVPNVNLNQDTSVILRKMNVIHVIINA